MERGIQDSIVRKLFRAYSLGHERQPAKVIGGDPGGAPGTEEGTARIALAAQGEDPLEVASWYGNCIDHRNEHFGVYVPWIPRIH